MAGQTRAPPLWVQRLIALTMFLVVARLAWLSRDIQMSRARQLPNSPPIRLPSWVPDSVSKPVEQSLLDGQLRIKKFLDL